MSDDREREDPRVPFNVNEAIGRANEMLGSMATLVVADSERMDRNLILATTIHKLVSAACAWKATRMTDVAAELAEELQKDMGASGAHVIASEAGEDPDDDGRPPRNLEELKARLGVNRKTDKR